MARRAADALAAWLAGRVPSRAAPHGPPRPDPAEPSRSLQPTAHGTAAPALRTASPLSGRPGPEPSAVPYEAARPAPSEDSSAPATAGHGKGTRAACHTRACPHRSQRRAAVHRAERVRRDVPVRREGAGESATPHTPAPAPKPPQSLTPSSHPVPRLACRAAPRPTARAMPLHGQVAALHHPDAQRWRMARSATNWIGSEGVTRRRAHAHRPAVAFCRRWPLPLPRQLDARPRPTRECAALRAPPRAPDADTRRPRDQHRPLGDMRQDRSWCEWPMAEQTAEQRYRAARITRGARRPTPRAASPPIAPHTAPPRRHAPHRVIADPDVKRGPGSSAEADHDESAPRYTRRRKTATARTRSSAPAAAASPTGRAQQGPDRPGGSPWEFTPTPSSSSAHRCS